MLLRHFSKFFTSEEAGTALEQYKQFKKEVVELMPQPAAPKEGQ